MLCRLLSQSPSLLSTSIEKIISGEEYTNINEESLGLHYHPPSAKETLYYLLKSRAIVN